MDHPEGSPVWQPNYLMENDLGEWLRCRSAPSVHLGKSDFLLGKRLFPKWVRPSPKRGKPSPDKGTTFRQRGKVIRGRGNPFLPSVRGGRGRPRGSDDVDHR